jgi:hypothetical protein
MHIPLQYLLSSPRTYHPKAGRPVLALPNGKSDFFEEQLVRPEIGSVTISENPPSRWSQVPHAPVNLLDPRHRIPELLLPKCPPLSYFIVEPQRHPHPRPKLFIPPAH